MKPEASVIVPTFNRRALVFEAIHSVLAQRKAQFELIVVDDGSADGTAEVIHSLNDRAAADGIALRLISTPNRGPAAARNAGVAEASAPLIAFLDSDDLWDPDKLRTQIDYMRRNPACAIVQTAELWFRNGRRVNPGTRHRKRAGDIFIESLRTCLISPSAVMMRAETFRAMGGFDEDFRAAEDYDLWLRVLRDHRAGLIDEPLVTRRAGHPDQLSATVPALDRFRILALLKLLAAGGLSPERHRGACEVLAEKCSIYAKGLYRRGGRRAADWFDGLPVLANSPHTAGLSGLEKTLTITRSMIRECASQRGRDAA